MQTKILNFKKVRDFGDLLSDTFTFLKQEYKFLGKVILTYAGPFVLITAIASAWMQSGMFSMMTMMVSRDPVEVFSEFGVKMAVYMLAYLVSTTMLLCTVYSYIGLYAEKGKDNFTQEEVWKKIGQHFFSIMGTLIVMGIIIVIGMILCFIPGIYISIAFTLVLASMFFENHSMGKAFERSMFLIRDDWWFTFGISIVISLLVGIAAYVFVLPASIVSIFLTFSAAQGSGSEGANILFMVLTTIGTFAASLLYCMPHITFSLLYFSQVEKKESPGLINKIEQINQPEIKEDENPTF